MPKKLRTIDHSRLLGFSNLDFRGEAPIDFKDKTIDARIGAKAGGEVCMISDLREMGLRPAAEPSVKK